MQLIIQTSCLSLLGGLILGQLMASPAAAAPRRLPVVPEGETVEPYVYGGVTYDDNVFLTASPSENFAVAGNTDQSDTIIHYGAGIRARKPVSLQLFRLDAAIEEVNYHVYEQLDHTAADVLGAWDWEVGRILDGTLSHEYTRGISDFTELQQAVKDVRTVNITHLDGSWHLLPQWTLELGGEHRNVDYDEQNFLDREENSVFAEVDYLTSVNTHVGLRYQYTEADLEPTSGLGGVTLINDYEEQSYSLVAGWEIGTVSYLVGRAGYTRREPEGNNASEFSGFTGRVTHQWQITPVTELNTSVYRNTNARDFQIASFVVTEGIALQPIYQVTPATRLLGYFAYESNDFQGAVRDVNGTIISDESREDEVARARATVDYAALTDLHLLLSVEYGNRNSTEADNEYDYTQVLAEVTYAF